MRNAAAKIITGIMHNRWIAPARECGGVSLLGHDKAAARVFLLSDLALVCGASCEISVNDESVRV